MLKKIIKKMNIVIAIMLALTMAFSVTTFAAGEASITVKAPEGYNLDGLTLDGLTFNAYKVLDRVGDDNLYTVTNVFNDFFEEAKTEYETETVKTSENIYLSYSDNHLTISNESSSGAISLDNSNKLDIKYFEGDLVSRLKNENLKKFSDWLSKYINSKGLTADKTVKGSEESTTITDLDEGYYALMTSGSAEGIAIQQTILQTSSNENVVVNLKAKTITVDKTVKNTNHTDESYKDQTTAQVGDTLDYKIESSVPDLTNYNQGLNYEYTIFDELINQKLNINSLEVKMNGTKIDLSEIILDNGLETTDNSFKIKFDVAKLREKGYSEADVIVTYSATLTSDAVVANNNTVTLTYTNNPYENTKNKPEDTTKVYTYGFEIQKTFSDGSSKFSVVQFELKNGNNAVEFVESNGVYKVADADDTDKASELGLDDQGKLKVYGLDVDKVYTLTEIATPDGYKSVSGTITLRADTSDPKLLLTDKNLEVHSEVFINGTNATLKLDNSDASYAYVTFDVLNQKGFTLPITGEAGIMIFVAGGIILIGLAGGLLFKLRKKEN